MADAGVNDLTLDSLNLGEDVGPPMTLESLEVGKDAELLVRIVNLLSGPQAARLMCVNRLLKRAVMASKWSPWSPEPHILADGTVCEPLSGRHSAVIRPGDDWARVRRVIADAPAGATVLMMQGVYEAKKTIKLNRPIYIFGNCAIIRGGERMGQYEPIFSCNAAQGALVGLSVEVRHRFGGVMYVAAGAFRLQGCSITAAETGSGVDVTGPATCPTIIDCKMRGGSYGCFFFDGACVTLRQCDVRDCKTGVYVSGGGNRSTLRIEGNVINGTDAGVVIDDNVDPAFTLGPGNTIHGGNQDIYDDRIYNVGNGNDDDDGDDV